MTTVEPRIAERRQRVSEDRARRRLRRLVWIFLLVVVVAAGGWLLRSPLLSVRSVTASGADRTDPVAVASTLGIVPGLPTISVDEAVLVEALLADPWVAQAEVDVNWPGSVAVTVVERVPVATASDGQRLALVSVDGRVLAAANAGDGAHLEVAEVPPPGGHLDEGGVGALLFLAALPAPLRETAAVTASTGELTAHVGGHQIRLGRPRDMEMKAAALVAVLESGIEPGAEVDLIAPLNPAVRNPQPLLEGEVESTTEGEPSG